MRIVSENEIALEGEETNPDGAGFWIEAGKADIWIRVTDEGVVVDIFNGEKEESLASCYVFNSELEITHE